MDREGIERRRDIVSPHLARQPHISNFSTRSVPPVQSPGKILYALMGIRADLCTRT